MADGSVMIFVGYDKNLRMTKQKVTYDDFNMTKSIDAFRQHINEM